MKPRIFYLFCLSMLTVPALAQIPRGTSMIGGSISLSRTESNQSSGNKSSLTSFGVQPGYGLFLIDNLCVGASVGLDWNKAKDDPAISQDGVIIKSRSLSAGPFVRYYVPIHDKLYAFAHASYNWQRFRTETTYTNSLGANPAGPIIPPIVSKTTLNTLALGAGVSYFLNPNIALEAAVSYSREVFKDPDPESNTNVTARQRNTDGLALSLGFQIFLRKSE